ncbi:MAG: TIGR03936 family radical SAM-associated protein [Eubacteriaceae bacterium]
MKKIRYVFKRSNELRFLSHLDQQRLFQRAFRRGNIKLEYSQGFNPHPKMSFALAMSVGLTSDCEFGEVVISENIAPNDFVKIMNAVLPRGLEILEAFYPKEEAPSLSSDIIESQYFIQIMQEGKISFDDMRTRLNNFIKSREIKIEKRNKKGKMVEKNIRPFIKNIECLSVEDGYSIRLNLAYVEQQCVKPELVLQSINNYEDTDFFIDQGIKIHREKLILSNGN